MIEPNESFDREHLLALLRRPFPAEERERFLQDIQALEGRLTALVPKPDVGPKLTRARLIGSATLREPPSASERRDLAAWVRANEAMAELVRTDAPLTFERIRTLNGILCHVDGPAPLRAKPTRVGLNGCPAPADIDALMAPMIEVVEERTRGVHPIAGAALLEQWIVSVHPFDDGNGRTSRLASDWALATHGYPPASYPTGIASVKALVNHGGEVFSVLETCQALLRGIEHTVALVQAA